MSISPITVLAKENAWLKQALADAYWALHTFNTAMLREQPVRSLSLSDLLAVTAATRYVQGFPLEVAADFGKRLAHDISVATQIPEDHITVGDACNEPSAANPTSDKQEL